MVRGFGRDGGGACGRRARPLRTVFSSAASESAGQSVGTRGLERCGLRPDDRDLDEPDRWHPWRAWADCCSPSPGMPAAALGALLAIGVVWMLSRRLGTFDPVTLGPLRRDHQCHFRRGNHAASAPGPERRSR